MENSAKQSATVWLENKFHQQSKILLKGQESYYRILQAQGSPYSHKVMTYMHYKGIHYKKIHSNQSDLKWAVEAAGQSIVPVMLSPDDQVMQDSTPIIEYLEAQHPEVSTIPEDPSLAFLMWLIEDFSDEYMPRMIMHTRWGNEQNRHTLSHKIARGIVYGVPSMQVHDLAPILVKRQTGFNRHLGLEGQEVRANMDKQVLDLLSILEEHFTQHQFLLGGKPCIADFALYGPLKVHFYEDPQSHEIMEIQAPHTCNWIHTIMQLGDTRGCAGQTEFTDWLNLAKGLPKSVSKLLSFIARTYIPLGKASVKASVNKLKQFDAEIDGVSATFSTNQYRVWAFEQLQLRYQSLADAKKEQLSEVLTESQIMPALMSEGIFHSNLFDGFTPPFVKDGIPDARIKYLKEKAKQAL